MLEPVFIDKALCLPVVDVAALLHGRMVVALSRVSILKGWTFALYPYLELSNTLLLEQQYHSHVSPLAKIEIAQHKSETTSIQAWAECENCSILHESEQFDVLSNLTIWTKHLLKKALEERQQLFLVFLRVYSFPEPIRVSANSVSPEKFGKFVGLVSLDNQFKGPLKIVQLRPILSNAQFNQRKKQIEELVPPLYLELEKLQGMVAHLALSNPAAKNLEDDIKVFLGWTSGSTAHQLDPDLGWIRTMTDVGNSSDGNEFEKLVRKSFIKLGFSNSLNNSKASLNPATTGGAGGLDIYCNLPYSLVGECKASKNQNVPTSVCSQLTYLGQTHLDEIEPGLYSRSIKVIFAAGSLTSAANKIAIRNRMNVIRPETLQRLVELKAKHPGAINLFNLKPCLENSPFGEDADTKVNNFIEQVWKNLEVRSNLVQAVKQLSETEPDRKQFEVAEIRVQYNVAFSGKDGSTIDMQTVYELLIELSSPLAGYLGRLGGVGLQSDRFYFLRDLIVD